MDPFSYICIMTSIVLGLAVSRLVTGMAQLLQKRRQTPAYWVHSVWMLNTLIGVVITWWVQYRWRHNDHWTLWLCLWLLAAPITYSFASALLFPNEQEGEPITDWRQHYYSTNRSFFLLIATTFAIDLVDTLLKGVPYFLAFGYLYSFSMVMLGTTCTIAAFTKSPRYHAGFAIFYLLWTLSMLGNNLLRLI